ncbi:hypothetical protein GCM10011402_07970 [Paracoccus acridae]|uniref:Uncharacterized protein n=1 Tax=Paracoccus acridae TaxID=1795310 RepID=A0ABQ1VDX9_9RHOB|nr:hypothetical protein GCM10011402_07970 [Paracoccus acridae]
MSPDENTGIAVRRSDMVRPLGAAARIAGVRRNLRAGIIGGGVESVARSCCAGRDGRWRRPRCITASAPAWARRTGNQTVKAFLTDFMATDQIKGIHNIWMKMDPPQLATEMKGVPFTIAR